MLLPGPGSSRQSSSGERVSAHTAARCFSVDALDVRVFEDGADLAVAAAADAAEAIRAAVRERGVANVIFASGVSQLDFLQHLASLEGVDWSRVTAFHMDEYVGIPADHPESLQKFMRDHVAARLSLRGFHYMQGDVLDAEGEAVRYAHLLRAHRPDVCFFGIGENGHLAFNDPHVADLDDPLDVKVVDLDDVSRMQQVGEGHFPTLDEVPVAAVTATIPALMRSHCAIALAMGLRKAEPVRRALREEVGSDCPASALRRHPDSTLYLDADAASLV